MRRNLTMKKLLYVLSLLIIASMVLAACGTPAATEAPAATQAPVEEPAVTEAPAEEPVATQAPAEEPSDPNALPRDETLYFNGQQWGPVVGWNPYSNSNNNAMAIASGDNARVTMFETPYLYNMLDGKQY